jgi:hypothetical protein
VSKGQSLTTEIEKTISDFERQREAIDRAISALREITGTAPSAARRTASQKKGVKRGPSPEGRARIAEAQRQRWAAKHAAERRAASKKASTSAGMAKKQPKGKKAVVRKKQTAAEAATPAKAVAAGQA